jgi:hypothetical protein
MASPTTYFVAEYDTLSGGSYTELSTTLLSWSGGTGFIVTDITDSATSGKLHCALVSGVIPTSAQVLTQGGVTSNCVGPLTSGNSSPMLYPAYFRRDVSLSAAGAYAWTGPADQVTHSFLFDGQSSNVVTGEILTFSGGQECEVITIVSDAGASGELDVRWITPIDSFGLPNDNDTFTGDIAGNGALNGVVHDRSYSALHIHRLSSDLKDDRGFSGNDVWSSYKPVPSAKDTDAIINLLGNVTITDEIARHMYGGSISQRGGLDLYSGWNIQITDRDGLSEPVLIQNDAIITKYWANALNPNSIQGRIRIMVKTRLDGVDIDGKRVKGKLLRYGDSYFEGSTTLGTATTALALFSTLDGNNQTAEGTVAGSPYNTVVPTEGYQTIDYNNGNGPQPFALSYDIGSATRAQLYERTKYIQREGSSETLFGRNARLFGGLTMNFAYDAESGNFQEDEIVAWGQNEIPYTGQSGNFTFGEVVVGTTSGARGRIVYDDDQGTTGTLLVELEGTTPFGNTETITGQQSTETATTGTVTTGNSNFGTGLLVALDDQGTTGNMYVQLLSGIAPSNNQKIYGATSLQTCLVNGTPSTRVVNNQYIGVFTGTNYQTNFGIGIDPTDAIAGDKLVDLLGVTQEPPNNQTGLVTGVAADMYVTCYPWDGASYDAAGDPLPTFGEMVTTATVTGGVSTTVVVGAGNIPNNTPAAGYLRLERDSDGEYDWLEYTSWENTTGTFTLGGDTPTAPNTATIGNNLMRALIDQLAGGTSVSYTAVVGTPEQVTITALRGGTSTPIKPAKATTTFGATGFSVNLQPQSDA